MLNQAGIVDLHTHTTASDGELSPLELVEQARLAGVSVLAITDHDSTAGMTAAATALSADNSGAAQLRLIAGLEVSACWGNMDIHVVGLDIDPADGRLQQRLQSQMQRRAERAERIAQRLEKLGYADTLSRAQQRAPQGIPARPHFAEVLVEMGVCQDRKQAFQRFLAQAKPAYVKTDWPDVAEAVRWIREAGGVAVLAHPGRYKLTRSKLERLVAYFADMGGQALEVSVSTHGPDVVQQLADFAAKYGLYASQGSDYHGPAMRWVQLGRMPPLPGRCRPVLELLAERAGSQ